MHFCHVVGPCLNVHMPLVGPFVIAQDWQFELMNSPETPLGCYLGSDPDRGLHVRWWRDAYHELLSGKVRRTLEDHHFHM